MSIAVRKDMNERTNLPLIDELGDKDAAVVGRRIDVVKDLCRTGDVCGDTRCWHLVSNLRDVGTKGNARELNLRKKMGVKDKVAQMNVYWVFFFPNSLFNQHVLSLLMHVSIICAKSG